MLDVGDADLMITRQGEGRESFLCGHSAHNQGMERMWRDVFNAYTVMYYQLFSHLEDIGILDIENKLHLFALLSTSHK